MTSWIPPNVQRYLDRINKGDFHEPVHERARRGMEQALADLVGAAEQLQETFDRAPWDDAAFNAADAVFGIAVTECGNRLNRLRAVRDCEGEA